MRIALGGHLRAVGHDQHLPRPRQSLETQAHGLGDRAAYALVDLVEDHHRLLAALAPGQRALQRQGEARQFAA